MQLTQHGYFICITYTQFSKTIYTYAVMLKALENMQENVAVMHPSDSLTLRCTSDPNVAALKNKTLQFCTWMCSLVEKTADDFQQLHGQSKTEVSFRIAWPMCTSCLIFVMSLVILSWKKAHQKKSCLWCTFSIQVAAQICSSQVSFVKLSASIQQQLPS